jgi:hypothetical protein
MDSLCYDLAVRQIKCQNGIAVTTDKVYTNVENNSQIILSYGYILTIISKNTTSLTISLYNFELLETVKFNIPSDTYRTFDLPLYNGSFVLLIGAVKTTCTCPRLLR